MKRWSNKDIDIYDEEMDEIATIRTARPKVRKMKKERE